MRIALLGANGQLAFYLKRTLSAEHEIVSFTHQDFDVTDHDAARTALTKATPQVILNTTAFHQVDLCETEVIVSFATNTLAVRNLAHIANDLDAVLMHLSTDYVFDGHSNQPYTEDASPRPLSVYANSKLAGEYFVRSIAKKHAVVRSCGLFGAAGSSGKGGNFVETMLRKAKAGEPIRVVSDQVLTPTYTRDLARQIEVLLGTPHYGLFHATNEGSCSWYHFAETIFEIAGLKPNLAPTTAEVLKTPAVRPKYSVLANARLKTLGLNRMRSWREGLVDYLREKHGLKPEAS